jgi:hypothetical protein
MFVSHKMRSDPERCYSLVPCTIKQIKQDADQIRSNPIKPRNLIKSCIFRFYLRPFGLIRSSFEILKLSPPDGLLFRFEEALIDPAHGTNPSLGKILENGPGRDTVPDVTNRRIIDIAANGATHFLHRIPPFLVDVISLLIVNQAGCENTLKRQKGKQLPPPR